MNADDAQVIGLTLGTAALSTLIIFPFGVALAWLLARKEWPGKSLVETIVALPLVMPPVATGLILLNLLGRRGSIGGFLQNTFGTEIVFTWKAVAVAGVRRTVIITRRAIRDNLSFVSRAVSTNVSMLRRSEPRRIGRHPGSHVRSRAMSPPASHGRKHPDALPLPHPSAPTKETP